MYSTWIGKKKIWYIDRNMTGYRPEIKIQYMDVNCAAHVLLISSTQKWKNRHLKQCLYDPENNHNVIDICFYGI